MPDPLETVLRLRRATVDDAKRTLAALLGAEAAAERAADAAEQRIADEAAAAADPAGGDRLVEAFGAWLPAGRDAAATARAVQERLAANVARARAALTVARASAEAVQALLDRRGLQRAAKRTSQAQAELDEVASRLRGPEDR